MQVHASHQSARVGWKAMQRISSDKKKVFVAGLSSSTEDAKLRVNVNSSTQQRHCVFAASSYIVLLPTFAWIFQQHQKRVLVVRSTRRQ